MLVPLLLAAASVDAEAHSWFIKALTDRYEFRSVSYDNCHLSKVDAREVFTSYEWDVHYDSPKSYYNAFGNRILPLQKQTYIPRQVAEYKKATCDFDARDEEHYALKSAMNADFLEALIRIERMKEKMTGKNYGELLQARELYGIKLQE